MHAYLVVLEIVPMNVGKTYAMLPLHCTLVHWFWLDLDPAELAEKLKLLAEKSPTVDLTSGAEEMYASKTKQGVVPVAVNTIELTPELKKLHFLLCEELDQLGVQYMAPQYVKEQYGPHVTHQRGEKLAAGKTHTTRAVYLVEADAPEYGNDRRICSKMELAGSE